MRLIGILFKINLSCVQLFVISLPKYMYIWLSALSLSLSPHTHTHSHTHTHTHTHTQAHKEIFLELGWGYVLIDQLLS